MSDIHTMEGSDNGERVSLIFHYAVPNTNNAVSINYRTLIKTYIADHTSVVPELDPAEQTQLDDGELFEVRRDMSTEGEKGLAQLQARAKDLYTEQQGVTTDILQNRYRYTGTDIDIL